MEVPDNKSLIVLSTRGPRTLRTLVSELVGCLHSCGVWLAWRLTDVRFRFRARDSRDRTRSDRRDRTVSGSLKVLRVRRAICTCRPGLRKKRSTHNSLIPTLLSTTLAESSSSFKRSSNNNTFHSPSKQHHVQQRKLHLFNNTKRNVSRHQTVRNNKLRTVVPFDAF